MESVRLPFAVVLCRACVEKAADPEHAKLACSGWLFFKNERNPTCAGGSPLLDELAE